MIKKILATSLCAPMWACTSGHSPQLLPEEETRTAGPDTRQYWQLPAGTLTLTAQGLQWRTQGKSFELTGEFDSVDVRAPFAAALTEGGHQLQLLALDKHGIVARSELVFDDILADAQCLYQSPHTGQLYSFVQDGDGASQQWLLAENHRLLATPRLARDLPVPYGTSLCTADDARGWLYIAEEDVGIWRLPAEPEAMPSRQAIALRQPWGPLSDDVEALRAHSTGDLLFTNKNALWLWQPQADTPPGWDQLQQWPLPFSAPELLSSWQQEQQIVVGLYDDKTGQWLELPLPAGASRLTGADLLPVITAVAETLPAPTTGDTMDDPAIWVNSADPANSRVLGTHKKAGLYVYNLAGEQLEFFADGRLNNIDVRSNGLTGGYDLAIATKRDDNSLLVYGIDAQGAVRKLTQLPTNLSAIYGVCIALFDDQQHVFVNDKDGRVQHYLLGYRIRSQREQSAGNFAARGEANSLSAKPIKPVYDQWNLTLAREFKLASQPEGCAVDDQRRVVFIGEENRGIWVGDARPDKDTRLQLIAQVGDTLHADVEGMAVVQRPGDAPPVLVVSSQGNDSYIVYEAVPPFSHLGGFRIGIDGEQGVDGSSETDGLDATSANLGRQFPAGLLVVQDGRNLMPSEGQNFKLVDWRKVVDILGL